MCTLDDIKELIKVNNLATNEICQRYCKYGSIWDADKMTIDITSTEICAYCPTGKLSEELDKCYKLALEND